MNGVAKVGSFVVMVEVHPLNFSCHEVPVDNLLTTTPHQFFAYKRRAVNFCRHDLDSKFDMQSLCNTNGKFMLDA
jgi:hypothetical protein